MSTRTIEVTFCIGFNDHTWKEDTIQFTVDIDDDLGMDDDEFEDAAEYEYFIKYFGHTEVLNADNRGNVKFWHVMDYDHDELLPFYDEEDE